MGDKILVDTSAWIDFFRKKDLGIYRLVSELLKEKRAVGTGIICLELLRGGKTTKEMNYLDDLFEVIEMVSPNRQTFISAGKMGQTLARRGFALSVVDLLIAQVAMESNLSLLTLDGHFKVIKKNFPLKLTDFGQMKKD
jgi:predicted nucleic acid-binding protein